MTDLAEFLLARITEDTERVRQAFSHGSADPTIEWLCSAVLADCAAKRRIVKLHKPRTSIWWPDVEACEVEVCDVCSWPEYSGPDHDVEIPCDTLKLLAVAFADHPDYNPDWRPDE